MSHIFAVLSALEESNRRPSSLQASEVTPSRCVVGTLSVGGWRIAHESEAP